MLRKTLESTKLAFRIFILGPWQPQATCPRCCWVPSAPSHVCWQVAGHKSGQSRERPSQSSYSSSTCFFPAYQRQNLKFGSLSGMRPVILRPNLPHFCGSGSQASTASVWVSLPVTMLPTCIDPSASLSVGGGGLGENLHSPLTIWNAQGGTRLWIGNEDLWKVVSCFLSRTPLSHSLFRFLPG